MGPVILVLKLSLSIIKVFFCQFIILRGLLKKLTDYFFILHLLSLQLLKNKIEIAEIPAQNQIFTTRFIADNFSNKTCGENLILGINFGNFNFVVQRL